MSYFVNKILKKIKVDLTEACNRNFERKPFVGTVPTQPTVRAIGHGSLRWRTTRMLNAVQSEIEGESIVLSFATPGKAMQNKSRTGGMPKRKQTVFSTEKETRSFGFAIRKPNSWGFKSLESNLRGRKHLTHKNAYVGAYTSKMPQYQSIDNATEVEKIIKGNINEVAPKAINNYLKQQFKKWTI